MRRPLKVWRAAAEELIPGENPSRQDQQRHGKWSKPRMLRELVRTDPEWRRKFAAWEKATAATQLAETFPAASEPSPNSPPNTPNTWEQVRRLEIERYGRSSLPADCSGLKEPSERDLNEITDRLGDLCPPAAANAGTMADRLFALRCCVRGGE